MKALRATLSQYSPADAIASAKALLAHSAQQDVLGTLRHSLLVYDNQLVNTRSGEYRQLNPSDDQSRAELLAQSARQLLPNSDTAEGILLLLPPAELVATRYHLALSGANLLRSALKLQAHTLIPAYEHELLLGVDASRSDGVALWYPAAQTNTLFQAFEAQGLFLAALMPRSLALIPAGSREQDLLITDEDSTHLVQLELRGGAIRSWHAIARRDLADPAFAEQWQLETAKAAPALRVQTHGWDDWSALRATVAPVESYCFFPQGAESYGRSLWRRKQQRAAAWAAGALVVLAFLPFLNNWVQLTWLEMQVDSLRDESATARQSQAAVYAMEDEWGVITDYPKQDVAQVLLTLNQYINSSLTGFTLDRGTIDITGYAQDPALLVEQLAEGEFFYDVTQSRSSSGGDGGLRGDRFGIRLKLSGVDFADYETRYPVVGK